jgi:hypothetical protein
MQLGLSSAAAPAAGVVDLVTACSRRGLRAVELRAGDGHGISVSGSSPGAIADLLTTAAKGGVAIAGYRTEGPADVRQLARLSESLGSAIIVADGCGIDAGSHSPDIPARSFSLRARRATALRGSHGSASAAAGAAAARRPVRSW